MARHPESHLYHSGNIMAVSCSKIHVDPLKLKDKFETNVSHLKSASTQIIFNMF